MTTTEILMLIQSIILLLTAGVLACYTWETKRLRETAAEQLGVMQDTLQLRVEEEKRAAEPVFVWEHRSAIGNQLKWEFANEGGPVTYVNVQMLSQNGVETGIVADIQPLEWLGTSRKGAVTFSGNISGEFRFGIGFRTRFGKIARFLYVASRETQPICFGSDEFTG